MALQEQAGARERAEAAPTSDTPSLLWPTVVLLAGAVMSSLSNSAVNAALPELTRVFNTSPATIAWVALAQALTSGTLLTVFGRLSDLTGRKKMYVGGLAIQVVCSALSGVAPNVGLLIAVRAIQGIGGAMVIANSLAYLIELYPANRRGFLVGAWEAAIAVGIASGPVLGGLLLSAFGWHAVFYIQVVIGGALLPFIPRVMHERPRPRRNERFDYLGALLFGGALAPLMYALTKAHQFGWASPVIIGFIALSLACLAGFITTELRVRHPMIQLGMFRSRAFSTGNLAKVFAYWAFAANSFLLPFYWDRALGLSPARLGLMLTAFPIGMLLGSLSSGTLSDRIGTRVLAPAGLLLMAVSALIQIWVTPEVGIAPVLLAAFLAGLGAGVFIAPNDSAILSIVPRTRLGVANGVMGVSRNLGSLFGQAVTADMLTARLAARSDNFVKSYHDVFVGVVLVALIGMGLATVRDQGGTRFE